LSSSNPHQTLDFFMTLHEAAGVELLQASVPELG
jgi:hypothetical protein